MRCTGSRHCIGMFVKSALWFCIVGASLSAVAGSTWTEHTGRCYYVHNTNQTEEAARETCASRNSSMTELESLGEYLAVNEVLGAYTIDAWVGLEWNATIGNFTWTRTGTKPEEAMWKPGEPNVSGYCVRLVKAWYSDVDLGLYRLADHMCYSPYKAFCEKPASPADSHSHKMATLPDNLCPVTSYVTSSLLKCAQTCAKELASCYVYSFQASSGACTFHRLSWHCSSSSQQQPGLVYYRMARACV